MISTWDERQVTGEKPYKTRIGGEMSIEYREWLDDDGCFKFGKCKDENVQDVARTDPSYLRWILENVEDIYHEDRDVIETALQYRSRTRK